MERLLEQIITGVSVVRGQQCTAYGFFINGAPHFDGYTRIRSREIGDELITYLKSNGTLANILNGYSYELRLPTAQEIASNVLGRTDVANMNNDQAVSTLNDVHYSNCPNWLGDTDFLTSTLNSNGIMINFRGYEYYWDEDDEKQTRTPFFQVTANTYLNVGLRPVLTIPKSLITGRF